MRFNRHSTNLPHAQLSPSKPAWLNYNDEKFDRVYTEAMNAARGSELHDLASKMIRLGVRLPDDGKTLSLYVNDCIGFRMTTEQLLFYSVNAYGTADAIAFRMKRLRIFDLKNGAHTVQFKQLEIYAALFCLEYLVKPFEIEIELRIYQNDEIKILEPDPVDIAYIMDRIKTLDRRIKELREEAGE